MRWHAAFLEEHAKKMKVWKGDSVMDKIDAMLNTLLQENAIAPLKVLASKVFLSAPAVSSRIDKLEKQGIILGYNTIIDRQKLGYHITAFINLELSAD